MSFESEELYLPPFCGVRMVEYHDHLALIPVASYRVIYGYGRVKATEVTVKTEDGRTEAFWDNCTPDEEVWAIIQLTRFEDGREVRGESQFIRREMTEAELQEKIRRMKAYYSVSQEQMLAMAWLYETSPEDHEETLGYIDANYPNYQLPPEANKTDAYDLYQARLKVLAGLTPITVELMKIANGIEDPEKRKRVEREAVGAYFAELAHYFTEAEVVAWQRSNPMRSGWLCRFAEVFRLPRRFVNRIDHELALNWLYRNYNLLTAEELSDEIFKSTLIRLTPHALKKRRERLGLTTKRPPGPRPKAERQ